MNILEKFLLKGRVSIITGGERGIGLSIARGFAQAGSDIAIAGLDQESAIEAKSIIENEGVKFLFIETDITNEEQVVNMVQKIMRQFGKIDVLVNNAGITGTGDAETFTMEQWRRVMDVNLNSQFLVSREVGKKMLENEKGSIINISSMSAMIVNIPQHQSAYNASKAGCMHLTKSLAGEWAKRGVRVNSIAPGYMRTRMNVKRFTNPEDTLFKKWMEMTPMGRIGEPEELVGLALYLASDASSYTTGAVIPVDGGYTVW